MKIAQIGSFSASAVDGVAQAGQQLVLALRALGTEVEVFSPGISAQGDAATRPGLLQRFGVKSPFSLPKALLDELRTFAPDIVHLHSVFTPSNISIAAKLRRSARPYVLTPHGGYNQNVFAKGRLKKLIFWRAFERRLVMNAAGVVCVASQEEADMRKLGYRGRVAVIPNAVPQPTVHIARTKIEPTILFMGRWDVHGKGIDRLLQLFAQIRAIDPEIRLELRGSGNASALDMLLKRMGDKNVLVAPPLFGSEKAARLSQVALYAQPSRWEVFGMAVAEAMFAGVPVLLGRECYLSASLTDINCGLILDHYDHNAALAVVALIRDPKRNAAVGQSGRDYANSAFHLPTIARKTLGFYRESVAGS